MNIMFNHYESQNKISILKNKFRNLVNLIDYHVPYRLNETHFESDYSKLINAQYHSQHWNNEFKNTNIQSISFIQNDNHNIFLKLFFQYDKIESEIIIANFMVKKDGYAYFSDILNLDLSIEILEKFVNAFNSENNTSIDNFTNKAFDIFITDDTKKLFDEFTILADADEAKYEEKHKAELEKLLITIPSKEKQLNKLDGIISKNDSNIELGKKRTKLYFEIEDLKVRKRTLLILIKNKYTTYSWNHFSYE